MMRSVPVLLGLGLATLWVVGMSVDATTWLTWADGAAAALALAAVGTIPARRGSAWGALCLGALAAGLAAAWLVGLATAATGWLAWWTFVAAGGAGAAALGVLAQGALDAVRTPEVI